MKKFLLSAGVIIIFLAYAWHNQQEAAGRVVVAPTLPTSPTSQPTTAPTTTPTAASGSSTPQPSQAPATPTPKPSGQYKDGSYTGSPADAFYGTIQVKAVISEGKITDVVFLQYPNDRSTSVYINSQAMPYLKQEALAAQSANVDIVSGATDSSMAFQQSLASALSQAK